MRPSAHLVTIAKYPGVVKCLRAVEAAHDSAGVDLCVEPAGGFDDVPALMRSAVDLIALDGHGCKNGYYGRQCEKRFCPDYLRGEDGTGIVAPIVVLGFCWGGRDPFISALEGSLGRSQVAFLGSTEETTFGDAKSIYLPILRLLAELGPSPDPGDAHARLTSIAPTIGPSWRSELLTGSQPPGVARRPLIAGRPAGKHGGAGNDGDDSARGKTRRG
jgi:hypothetical protein